MRRPSLPRCPQVRFGIGRQLGLAFGFVLLVLGAFVGGAYLQQREMEGLLHDFGDIEIDRIREVDRWIALSEDVSTRVMAVNKSNDAAITEFFQPTIAPRVREADEIFESISRSAATDEESTWMAGFASKREELLRAVGEMNEFKKIGDVAGASAMFDSAFLPAQKAYSAEIKRFGTLQRELLEQKLQRAISEGKRVSVIAGGVALLLTLAGAFFAWRVATHIKSSLDMAVDTVLRVAKGDLSQRIEVRGRDEFAVLMQAIAAMNQGLLRIVQEVRKGTESIAIASSEIAQGNSDLSCRTEQQASNLERTSNAMDQLTRTVHASTSQALSADDHARQATAIVTRGGEVVQQVVSTMEQISQASKRIEEIIGVINGIAFQTNILALNASVEAARAGEQGRGFAVVAGEVRNLAQRSAQAAKEIKVLIADSACKVQNGTSQVEAAGRAMNQSVAAIQQVSELMASIRSAASEQTAGIQRVNTSISELDQITQQNAALGEQAAAAAVSMKRQAGRLQVGVAAFCLHEDEKPEYQRLLADVESLGLASPLKIVIENPRVCGFL